MNTVPFPISLYHPAAVAPMDIGATGGTVFLAIVDEFCQPDEALQMLAAYLGAFTAEDDVSLLLYLDHPALDSGWLGETIETSLGYSLEAIPDLIVLEEKIAAGDRPGLFAACTAFLTLTADERSRVSALQALAMEKQVIAVAQVEGEPLSAQVAFLIPPGEWGKAAQYLRQIYDRQWKAGMRQYVLEQFFPDYTAQRPKTLFFVPTEQHLAPLLTQYSLFDPQAQLLVTNSFLAGIAAQQQDLSYRYLDSYLTDADCERNAAQAYQLTTTWHLGFSDQLVHRGIPLAKVAETDMVHAFTHCLNAYTAFSRLLDENDLAAVVLFDEMRNPGYCGSLNGTPSDVSHAVLAWLAQQRGIPVQYLPAVPYVSTIGQASPVQAPRLCSYVPARELLEKYQQKGQAKRTILAFGMPSDFAQLGHLPRHLWQDPETCFVYIYDHPLQVSHENSLTLDFRPFMLWPFDMTGLDTLVEEAWQHFSTDPGSLAEAYPYLFANPFLRFLFQPYFAAGVWFGHEFSLRFYGRVVEATRLLLESFQPDLCLFGFDGIGSLRCRTETVKSMGIPTMTISHFTMSASQASFNVYDNTNADIVAVAGEAFRQRLIAFGRPAHRVEAIGDLSWASRDLGSQDPVVQPSQPVTETLQTLAAYIQDRPMVLILTSAPAPCLYETMHLEALEQGWQAIANLARQRKDLAFVVKTHPRFDCYEFYQAICQQPGSNLFLVGQSFVGNTLKGSTLVLDDLLPLARVAMLVNVNSSTSLQLLSSQIPLLYLRNAIVKSDQLIGHIPLDWEGCWAIDRLEELPQAVQESLFNPARRQELIALGQLLIQNEMARAGDAALAYVLGLIERLTGQSAPKQAAATLMGLYVAMLAAGLRTYLQTQRQEDLQYAMELATRHLPDAWVQQGVLNRYLNMLSYLPYTCV